MAQQLLTPSPSPPPTAPPPTLPAEINAATRKQHILLNRLIVDRLSLALPPAASDPSVLGHGLAAFARIYFTFEDAWQHIEHAAGNEDTAPSGGHDAQVLRWLSTLRPEGLHRSSRLKEDLQHLSRRTGTQCHSEIPARRNMIRRMQARIDLNPHTLVAYGWVMNMAIFSGGRWIRQQLSAAGTEFWIGRQDYWTIEKHDVRLLELPGFSFLSFDGNEDGEDIKKVFRSRLAEAETLLTQQERHDVVVTAQQLFEDCIALVGELDRETSWQRVWTAVALITVWIVGLIVIYLLFRYSNLLAHEF